MRTRRSAYSPDGVTFMIRPKTPARKRRKLSTKEATTTPIESSSSLPFDRIHDEVLVSIMASLSSSATNPADLINAMLTCKRFCAAGAHPLVLKNVSTLALAIEAKKWSDGAYRFLQQCEKSGNVEAAYTLGMIRFYCFNEHENGAALMAKAALKLFAPALHSLAVIQFNGSGGSRKDRNLENGASLCAKAAAQGHVDAIRELGHCLQDGLGISKNVAEGRRLLLEANALEAAAALAAFSPTFVVTARRLAVQSSRTACGLREQDHYKQISLEKAAQMLRLLHRICDSRCDFPAPRLHIANQFLASWFSLHPPSPGLRLCSHRNCGRPEMRRHEFRRCSACGTVNYCSRACQALDWKVRHMVKCVPVADWVDREEIDEGVNERREGDLHNT